MIGFSFPGSRLTHFLLATVVPGVTHCSLDSQNCTICPFAKAKEASINKSSHISDSVFLAYSL